MRGGFGWKVKAQGESKGIRGERKGIATDFGRNKE